ncbi:MAG: (d)CMP kinase [Lachnospiraceae bacterium]|nr:(d)CMP kinase [Lachnospiraceae bacterium]
MGFQVAIDGPAGAGKSTIAKLVAKKKNFIYVDTGAMYRAVALFLLRNNIKAEDADAVAAACLNADITINYENGEQIVLLNGENVNSLIRTEEVGSMASAGSANPHVRAHLLNLQLKLAEQYDVVMDGRDIGTCILPNAEVKIFLTASSHVRANRRYLELKAKGIACDLNEIEEDIKKRDFQDMTRKHSPLRQADDAVLVDSSQMSIDDVVACLIQLI